MSKDTRDVIEVGKQEVTAEQEEVLSRDQKKARLAQVLDRGLTADRLHVPLPSGIHGEWVPNDQSAIYEKEALGFKIDTEYAPKRALHSKGDGKSIVGDVVYMICDKENKEIIDEIRNEQYLRLNRKQGTQKEERDITSQTSKIGLEPINEGSVSPARKEELENAMGITKD
jgi:hypothetical protein